MSSPVYYVLAMLFDVYGAGVVWILISKSTGLWGTKFVLLINFLFLSDGGILKCVV